MKLHHNFTVPLPIEEAWHTLTDLEFVAPCLPGAALTGRDGDDYLGTVRVKVGPITSQFGGVARFTHQDAAEHTATIQAEGRDTKGSSAASAVIDARLTGDGASTMVTVETDLAITGKFAQFGRGAIADISAKLLEQFTDNLAQRLTETSEEHTDDVADAMRDDAPPEPAPVDLARLVGAPAKVGVLGVVVVVVTTFWLLSRGAHRRAGARRAAPG